MGYLQSSAVPKSYADSSTQEGEGRRKNKASFLFFLIGRLSNGGNSYAKRTSAQHKMKKYKSRRKNYPFKYLVPIIVSA
jgi:hypothetical protein